VVEDRSDRPLLYLFRVPLRLVRGRILSHQLEAPSHPGRFAPSRVVDEPQPAARGVFPNFIMGSRTLDPFGEVRDEF